MNKELQKRILSSFILIPLSFFFIIKGSFLFNFFLLICLIITFFEWFAMTKKKNYHLFGYIFLTFAFYSAYALRNNFADENLIIFLLIIITCISTDIGGYVFGKFFKGPKLTKISPNKTLSGALGSLICSGILFSTIIYIMDEI